MMDYAIQKFGIKRFYCKINATNQPSISLFLRYSNKKLSILKQKISYAYHIILSLGFIECKFVEAFQEYEFEYHINEESKNRILSNTSYRIYLDYSDGEDIVQLQFPKLNLLSNEIFSQSEKLEILFGVLTFSLNLFSLNLLLLRHFFVSLLQSSGLSSQSNSSKKFIILHNRN